MTKLSIENKTKLQWQQVRWVCDTSQLRFETTKDIAAANTIVGQEEALEALEYSLESRAFGQNAFVRGLYGSDRMKMIALMLQKNNPQMPIKHDQCYVANFHQLDRPRLITLNAGDAKFFKRWMKKFSDFVTKDLNDRIDSEDLKTKKSALEEKAAQQIKLISRPFDQKLTKDKLILVNYKTETGLQSIISPLHDGKPIDPQQWQKLIDSDKINEEQQKITQDNIIKYSAELQNLAKSINHIKYTSTSKTQELIENKTRQILHAETTEISKRFHTNAVLEYLLEACEDVIEQFFYSEKEQFSPHNRYSVNILV